MKIQLFINEKVYLPKVRCGWRMWKDEELYCAHLFNLLKKNLIKLINLKQLTKPAINQ